MTGSIDTTERLVSCSEWRAFSFDIQKRGPALRAPGPFLLAPEGGASVQQFLSITVAQVQPTRPRKVPGTCSSGSSGSASTQHRRKLSSTVPTARRQFQERGRLSEKKTPAFGISTKAGAYLKLAPRAGFEPATCRLTVECSTAELPGITARRGVSGLIQMLARFAKRFFQKNDIRLYSLCITPSPVDD